MLLFGGALHIVSGKIVVEAGSSTPAAARRLRTNLSEIFGQQADFAVVHKGGLRKGTDTWSASSTGRAACAAGRPRGRFGPSGAWVAAPW